MNPDETVFDAFAELGLTQSPCLSAEVIETAWHELSREHHPDAETGDSDRAAAINRARQILQTPATRLRHWLDLKSVEIPKDISISNDLMELFTEAGQITTATDAFIRKKQAATTAIAKAVLAEAEYETQETLQSFMQKLNTESESVVSSFEEIEAAALGGDFSKAIAATHFLGFLTKWERECRERLIAVIT